jgi:hypothetical protein
MVTVIANGEKEKIEERRREMGEMKTIFRGEEEV